VNDDLTLQRLTETRDSADRFWDSVFARAQLEPVDLSILLEAMRWANEAEGALIAYQNRIKDTLADETERQANRPRASRKAP